MDAPPHDAMSHATLTTISLLESRLMRLEHLLYGTSAPHHRPCPPSRRDSAVHRLHQLDQRFSALSSRVRVYGELLKIYRASPDLFHAPDASEAPSQLSTDAMQSIVLASASSYPATLSSLTAIKDSPMPDPSESAALIASTERIKAMEATQLAQAAELAELRRRSEAAVRSWYQGSVLVNSQALADVEGRVEGVERHVRRRERERDDDM